MMDLLSIVIVIAFFLATYGMLAIYGRLMEE